jgi:hypothetical protein
MSLGRGAKVADLPVQFLLPADLAARTNSRSGTGSRRNPAEKT